MALKLWQVDAFAAKPLEGNPAAIVPLEAWLDDGLMQRIASENNLAETAFFVKTAPGKYDLRWFTPACRSRSVRPCHAGQRLADLRDAGAGAEDGRFRNPLGHADRDARRRTAGMSPCPCRLNHGALRRADTRAGHRRRAGRPGRRAKTLQGPLSDGGVGRSGPMCAASSDRGEIAARAARPRTVGPDRHRAGR